MINVTLFQQNKVVHRIRVEGHAGYADHGNDIVCAAVSILVINTINSIEKFTDEPIKELAVDQKKGLIDVSFPSRKNGEGTEEAELLIRSMIHGLMTIFEMYGEKYIQIQIN